MTTCRLDKECFLFGAKHCAAYRHPGRDAILAAVRRTADNHVTTAVAVAVAAPSPAATGEAPRLETVADRCSPSRAVGAAAGGGVGVPLVMPIPLPRSEMAAIMDVAQRLNPADPLVAWCSSGVRLTGAFARLRAQTEDEAINAMMLGRAVRDPPELEPLLTLSSADDSTQHPRRYLLFRDDPRELPHLVVSIAAGAAADDKYEIEGSGIASVLAAITKDPQLVQLAATAFPGLDKTTAKKRRAAACIAKTHDGLGIVVPYEKKSELGYREPMLATHHLLRIVDALNAGKVSPKQQQELDEQVQFSDISNDECDFGLGLHLGRDMYTRVGRGKPANELCHHMLSMAYSLLGREAFRVVLETQLRRLAAPC